ncbi:MAG TPA: protein kinase [Gemmatales bacterium]|nr:protein kinase [Gemmatales bacterium]
MSATLDKAPATEQVRPISTGLPGLDYELALAGGGDLTDLAMSVYQAAERLEVPLQGVLPPLEMPHGDMLDRQLTRSWTNQLRSKTKAIQAKLPTLLDILARLEFSVGEFQNAQRNFMALAHLGDDQQQQALARYHAFRSAIERPNYPDASVELRYASSLSPRRFSPVQLDRFDPEQVVYSDAIGLTVRCTTRNTLQKEDVFVRSLDTTYLDRSIQEVFEDQKKLAAVNHRAILPVRGTGHVTPEGQRPFIVTLLYEASTVDQYVQRSGVISPRDFLPLFQSLVEGLMAAHNVGVLHRGLRPEYILIRRKVSGYSGVISNFGQPLKRSFYEFPIKNPSYLSATQFGRTLSNALDYVAPEQIGKRPEPVDTATDVYSLAKVACLALFATPHPALNHWRLAGEGLAGILHDCVNDDPAKRPTLAEIKDRIVALQDPQAQKAKLGQIDPKMAALIATYQPPPGVGMTAVPTVPAGMAIRRRLSTREVLWSWRFQMLKWGSGLVLIGMVAAFVAAIFWNPGAPSVNRKGPVPASGVLMLLDEKPIANANLRLIPEGVEMGVRPHAKTDSQGHFTFTTSQEGDGAPAGRYKVVVEKEPMLDRARLLPNIPESDTANFRNMLESPLLLETDVHRAYSSERDTKLRLIIEPNGSTDLKIVLNYLGR